MHRHGEEVKCCRVARFDLALYLPMRGWALYVIFPGNQHALYVMC